MAIGLPLLLRFTAFFSSEDEEVVDYENPNSAIRSLCFFTKYMEEKRHELPRETYETLVNRIDPNSGESLRETVQSLLYTPGGKL